MVRLAFPFTGRWLTPNSPANRVASHGTTRFATSYGIDFVPVNHKDATAPIRLGSLLRPEPPQRFVGFGRPVLADRKSTRLNSSHVAISYAVFCLKKKKEIAKTERNVVHVGEQSFNGAKALVHSSN